MRAQLIYYLFIDIIEWFFFGRGIPQRSPERVRVPVFSVTNWPSANVRLIELPMKNDVGHRTNRQKRIQLKTTIVAISERKVNT